MRVKSGFLAVVLILALGFPLAFANTGAIHLTSSYNYKNTHYNTYLFWGPDLYGDRLNYGLGTDEHINFTNFSTVSASNPSWTFGEASQNGNATINIIAANYIRFATTWTGVRPFNQTFYFAGSIAQVDFNHAGVNTSIGSAGFQSSYANFLAASAPAVWHNSSGGYYLAKYNVQPTSIQWDLTAPSSPFTVTMAVSPAGGGTTTPTGTFTESAGTNLTITATPAAGYSFSSWTSSAAGCTFLHSTFATTNATINATCTITANFTFNGGVPTPGGMLYSTWVLLAVVGTGGMIIGLLRFFKDWRKADYIDVILLAFTGFICIIVALNAGQLQLQCDVIASWCVNGIQNYNQMYYFLYLFYPATLIAWGLAIIATIITLGSVFTRRSRGYSPE